MHDLLFYQSSGLRTCGSSQCDIRQKKWMGTGKIQKLYLKVTSDIEAIDLSVQGH